jgi:hypothetical protein
MSSFQPRAGARRLPLVLGGLVIAGAVTAIAIVLATGDSRSATRDDDTSPKVPPPVSDAVVDAALAAPPVVADAGGEPVAPVASNDFDESDCRGLETDRKWDELEKCADRLKATDPVRAEAFKARAVEEAKAAPRIAAVEDAIGAKDLKRAQAALDQVWTGSRDYERIKRRYAAAEGQAITVLAAKLESALSPSCTEYNALLAKQRAAQPPRVTAEAARQVTCTPLSPTRCDAKTLAEEGRQLHAAGKLVRAVASYEASWTCSRSDQTATRGFLIACNLPSLPKAKAFWKRLPAADKPSVTSCENNNITRQQLDAP